MIENCGNCRYLHHYDAERPPVCRRRPPQVSPIYIIVPPNIVGQAPVPRILATVSLWPEMQPDGWCGEWEVAKMPLSLKLSS